MEPTLSGQLFQVYVDTLTRLGLLEAVRERVPPHVRAFLDHPPGPQEWIGLSHADELLAAAAAAAGPERLLKLAQEISVGSLARVLPPTAAKPSERTPGRFLALSGQRLHSMMRGLTIRFREHGEGAGLLLVEYSAPVSRLRLQAWAGAARAAIERCGLVAVIGEPAIDGDLRRCEIPLRWTTPPAPH